MLKIGENIIRDTHELFEDDDKYIFSFELDLDFDSIGSDKLNVAYDLEDKDMFIDAYNKWADSVGQPAHIVKIFDMHGPGGGWPAVVMHTTKFMTFSEATKELSDMFGSEADAVDALTNFFNCVEVVKLADS